MTTRTVRTMSVAASAAWLVLAAEGVAEAVADDSGWERSYVIVGVAIVVGAALSVAVAARLTEEADRPKLRTAGLVVAALGGVVALIGPWLLPVWMFLLGVGFGMVAAASAPRWRRPMALLATAQLAGIVVLIGGITAEIGRRDSYGDYPVAEAIALGFVGLATIAALLYLTTEPRRALTARASAG
ncbi:MAG: hypothetical protein ACRD2W_15915 [Acidimicrobiales bacterium]